MRWTPRGAQLLLQVRTRVLYDQLAGDFHRWYPASTRRRTGGARGVASPTFVPLSKITRNVRATIKITLSDVRLNAPSAILKRPATACTHRPAEGVSKARDQAKPGQEL